MSQATLQGFGELEKKQLVPKEVAAEEKKARGGMEGLGVQEAPGDAYEETHPSGVWRTCRCHHTWDVAAMQAFVENWVLSGLRNQGGTEHPHSLRSSSCCSVACLNSNPGSSKGQLPMRMINSGGDHWPTHS